MDNTNTATAQATIQNVEGQQQTQTQETEKITLTQEELNLKLQTESDKRVSQALKTAQSKWEAEYTSRLEAENAEAEKLAKMTVAEKEKALLDKTKAEIESKEKALQQRELKLETVKILSEKKLPIEFSDILLGFDAETTKANIDSFEKLFNEKLELLVNERLKGNSHVPNTNQNNTTTTTTIFFDVISQNKLRK